MNYLAVWVGDKYGSGYVGRLRSMLKRHGEPDAPFIVLTDKPTTASAFCDLAIDIKGLGLKSWWAKMALFSPSIRGWGHSIYFDLDTVIVGSLKPLMALDVPFGICANFTRAAGNKQWPCTYGSCCMVFDAYWGSEVWAAFEKDRAEIMRKAGKYGDQFAIEMLAHPAEVTILQEHLPKFFFTGYRDLIQYRDEPPPGCAVVVFAGTQKPSNCTTPWVRREWR
jgi:hypothetical protein